MECLEVFQVAGVVLHVTWAYESGKRKSGSAKKCCCTHVEAERKHWEVGSSLWCWYRGLALWCSDSVLMQKVILVDIFKLKSNLGRPLSKKTYSSHSQSQVFGRKEAVRLIKGLDLSEGAGVVVEAV